jgi:iron complex transport system substrate-binding protein
MTRKPKRIVSLIASSTEIVCALGLEAELVGRSHECDFPPSVKRLPACSEPKIDVTASSREIDRQVKEIVRDGLSVYRIHAETLRKLKPDVILTQIQCEVCAVSEQDVMDAVRAWVGYPPQIVSLEPNALEDIWRDFLRVAEALDIPERGAKLVQDCRRRMAAIADRAEQFSHRPRVACLEWIDPLMAGGNWLPELVAMAGGINIFGEAGKHSPWMNWEDLSREDPDVIITLPCGYDMERTRQELPALTGDPRWSRLKAVRNKRVYLADGNQYFNRPGPRVVESLECLAEMIHPEGFRFSHEGEGWVLFNV